MVALRCKPLIQKNEWDCYNELPCEVIMSNSYFEFKQFRVEQGQCAMKVGTDGTLLGAWAAGGGKILDIGTGTGLVALMMAQRFPSASVTAVEIDHEACLQATANFGASPFCGRLRLAESSIQTFTNENNAVAIPVEYDAIVCNPPYFVNSLVCPDGQRTLARHTASLSFGELFRCVSSLISDKGVFSAVIPADAFGEFDGAARMTGLRCVRKCLVKTVPRKQPRRCLVAFLKDMRCSYEESAECLADARGNRSEWYSRLTEDFYVR